jgi:hypothetical protein
LFSNVPTLISLSELKEQASFVVFTFPAGPNSIQAITAEALDSSNRIETALLVFELTNVRNGVAWLIESSRSIPSEPNEDWLPGPHLHGFANCRFNVSPDEPPRCRFRFEGEGTYLEVDVTGPPSPEVWIKTTGLQLA